MTNMGQIQTYMNATLSIDQCPICHWYGHWPNVCPSRGHGRGQMGRNTRGRRCRGGRQNAFRGRGGRGQVVNVALTSVELVPGGMESQPIPIEPSDSHATKQGNWLRPILDSRVAEG